MFFPKKKYRPGLSSKRIEAFSDGVFTVAITLLVLGIAVPVLTPLEVSEGGLLPALLALWPKFLVYVVSYFIIGIFWSAHHIMFHYIQRSDRMLLWLNLVFLLMISFLPFPVALIGQYSRDMTAIILYGSTLFLAGFFFALIWLYATREHRLVAKDLDPKIITLGMKVILLAPITYGIALLLAPINPLYSLALYILTPIFYLLPSPVDALVHAASSEEDA